VDHVSQLRLGERPVDHGLRVDSAGVEHYMAIAERGRAVLAGAGAGLGQHPDDGLPTQASTLAEAGPMARDLIATYLDVNSASFTLNVEVAAERWPDGIASHSGRNEAAGVL
jgi:hypothetical protein